MSNAASIELAQAWYPIAKSSAVKRGQRLTFSFLNSEWVLFRTQNDILCAVRRYCIHMGADLSRGKVIGDKIQCPLHSWQFDGSGKCHHNESETDSMACEEYGGIVFVFPAKIATYNLPINPGITSFSSVFCQSYPIHFLSPVVNAFDLSHYEKIHRRRFLKQPEINSEKKHSIDLSFTATIIKERWYDRLLQLFGVGKVHISIESWGGSLLIMRNQRTGTGAIIGILPGEGASSTLYMCAYSHAGKHSRMLTKIRLEVACWLTRVFLRADLPYLSGMIPHRGDLDEQIDRGVIEFWNYYEQIPKSKINQQFYVQ